MWNIAGGMVVRGEKGELLEGGQRSERRQRRRKNDIRLEEQAAAEVRKAQP